MDRSRLVQAFSNLLHNAIEAYEGTTRAPVVSIQARVQPGISMIVLFSDTGCGMSPEVLRDAPKLFSSRKQEHARGFGLPLAIKIIESEHGGSLSIESSVGKGTTVTVALPTQQERP
jgi:signal transduction histidine kinase